VRGKFHLYLLEEAILTDHGLKKRFGEKYREWKGLIETELDKVLPAHETGYGPLAALILAALDGLIIQSLLGLESLPLEEITGRLVPNP
jgi:hypothetical protein